MLPPRLLGGFFLRLIVLYVLLTAPWPGLTTAYAEGYRTIAGSVFGSFGSRGIVRFEPWEGHHGNFDTQISVRRRDSRIQGSTGHDSRLIGFMPTVQVVALILATPIAWSRRWKALVWGLLLVHLTILLRLEITLLHLFSTDGPWKIYEPGRLPAKLLARTFEVTVISPTLSFILPVFVWVLATFRRADWALVFPSRRDRRGPS